MDVRQLMAQLAWVMMLALIVVSHVITKILRRHLHSDVLRARQFLGFLPLRVLLDVKDYPSDRRARVHTYGWILLATMILVVVCFGLIAREGMASGKIFPWADPVGRQAPTRR